MNAVRALAIACALGAGGAAQPRAGLPAGVTGVTFGQAHRYAGAGKEMCTILTPLASPPTFAAGTTEITYAVALEPVRVGKAAAQVIAPAGQQLRGAPCNVFMPVKGGFSQTQLGSSLSRVDGGPLVAGTYTLRITVDGQTADVAFTVR